MVKFISMNRNNAKQTKNSWPTSLISWFINEETKGQKG